MAAIGLAFVDIVGDTSRTEAQIERDMNRVLDETEDRIDPLEIRATVDAGAGRDLQRDFRNDIRAIQAAIQSVQVNASLSPETQARLTGSLRESLTRVRAAAGDLQVRLDHEALAQDATEAVVEAVHVAEAAAPDIELNVDIDRDAVARTARDFSQLGTFARGALGPVGLLARGFVGVGAAGNAIATAQQAILQLGPAAAVAVPALLTVKAAAGTLKLAMSGVQDAVTAALDPSDPQAFADALSKLSPQAQKFALEVQKLQPTLHALQQSVQDAVFKDFGTTLEKTASAVLPSLRAGLTGIGGVLNEMGKSAAGAAAQIGSNGVLDQALTSARQSMAAFSNTPGIAVKAFGELAAAAGPSLEKIAGIASNAIAGLGGKLDSAFASGGLQKAIGLAVDQFLTLGSTIGNVLKILENISSTANGVGSLLGVLNRVTGVLADVTGTDQAQRAFQAIFDTLNALTSSVLPLVTLAFKDLAGVVIAIAPGAQKLITTLGDALKPVLDALGPVLASLAGAIGNLVIAFSPLLQTAGELIASILPILVPFLDGLSQIFVAMAPVIQNLATQLTNFLKPILDELPGILKPIIDSFVRVAQELFPQVNDLLTQLAPSFDSLSKSIADLFVALGPVIVQLADLSAKILTDLSPLLPPLIDFIARLAKIFAQDFANAINDVAIPALRGIVDILNGDTHGAFVNFEQVIKGVAEELVKEFFLLPVKITQAIGDLALTMEHIGEDIIRSLISGIKTQLSNLGGVLDGVTNFIKDHKGPIETDRVLLTPAGVAIMQGLMAGISSQVPALQSQLAGLTGMVGGTQMALPGVTAGVGGNVVTPSAASQMAARSGVPTLPGGGAPNVQVFIGDQELTNIVDVRVAAAEARTGRLIANGMRR